MPMETRGGVPQAVGPIALTTTPVEIATRRRFGGISKSVRIQNLGAQVVRVYFSAEDATAGANYITIPVAANGISVLEAEIETNSLWLAAGAATTSADVLYILRRG